MFALVDGNATCTCACLSACVRHVLTRCSHFPPPPPFHLQFCSNFLCSKCVSLEKQAAVATALREEEERVEEEKRRERQEQARVLRQAAEAEEKEQQRLLEEEAASHQVQSLSGAVDLAYKQAAGRSSPTASPPTGACVRACVCVCVHVCWNFVAMTIPGRKLLIICLFCSHTYLSPLPLCSRHARKTSSASPRRRHRHRHRHGLQGRRFPAGLT